MAQQNTPKRKVVIGLDGVPFRLVEQLTTSGQMPNLGHVIRGGVFRQMASSIPEISSVAWSSIITGANPGQHGIYGFTDLSPGTCRLRFPNSSDLRVPPFWLRNENERSVILNVPSTYPAGALNGVLIAGFVALDLNKAVFPRSFVPKLQKLNYHIDVDTEKAHKSKDLFLEDLDDTLKSRIALFRYLWDAESWQNFMLVFTGTDRLGHFLWDAFEEPNHPYREAFLNHFRQIDEVIGEISERLRPDDGLIILSDHGFESLEKIAHVNRFLKELGFLRLRQDPARSLTDVGEGTTAFALDPARIYVHASNRYPKGHVNQGDRPAIIRDLIQACQSWKIEGKPVVRRICHRDEIYRGPYVENAPDLVLISERGVDLRGGLKASEITGKPVLTGKHTQHDAFFIARGQTVGLKGEEFSVSDVLGVLKQV